jgi:hypothetical protein
VSISGGFPGTNLNLWLAAAFGQRRVLTEGKFINGFSAVIRHIGLGAALVLGMALSTAGTVAAQPAYPADSEWIWFANDPEEGGLHNDQRDVESLYYHVRDGYLFLRMKNRGPAGWCTTCGASREHARYKWFFDTVGADGVLQGGHVRNSEFLLFTEDFDNNLNGEVVFIDNAVGDDYNSRWSTTNPPEYTTGIPVGAPFANWQRQLGAVDTSIISPVPPIASTQYLGIPQLGGNAAVGYRVYGDTGPLDDPNGDMIPGPFPDGIYVDMYIDVDLLGAPDNIRLVWLTDQEDQNLDQAPQTDRPDDGQFIVIPLVSTLTIEKEVPGGNAQDFSFTLTPGVGVPTVFDLDDDADGTLPNTRVLAQLDPGSFTITEGPLPMGWAFGALTCVNGNGYISTFTTDTVNRSAAINLEAGSDVYCRFVNVGPPPPPGNFTLAIVKDARPHGAQLFDFTVVGGMVNQNFQLSDPGNASTSIVLTQGQAYTLSEAAVAGWITTMQCSDPSIAVVGATAVLPNTIPAGALITCVYENTQLAAVAITKQANQVSAGTFNFTSTLPGAGAFALTDGQTQAITGVTPGNYSVTEASQLGYLLQNIVCSDSTGASVFNTDLSTGNVDMVVAPGAQITCTFINGELGHLVFVKDAIPDDPSQSFAFETGMGNFSLVDDGSLPGDCVTPSVNSICFDDIAPGDYPTRELPTAGWLVSNIVCSGGQAVIDVGNAMVTPTVGPGATVVCVFTNQRAPQMTAPIPMLERAALVLLAASFVLFGLVQMRRRT